MTQYQIIDNFLENHVFLKIQDAFSGGQIPWFYSPGIAKPGDEKLKTFYFTHTLYDGHSPQSKFYELLVPIFERLQVKALLRAKANLFPNIGEYVEAGMHSDWDFKHNGAIFYINTNNGFTILNDGTKIESVANRVLLFDSSLPHASTFCTDQKVRANININYF